MFWKKPLQSMWTTGEGKKILLPEDEHKILVWNIFKASRDQIAFDLQKLSKDAEFLLLQEILKSNHNDWQKALENFHLQMAESFEFRHRPTSTGVGIASTCSPISGKALNAQEGDMVGLGPPKATLFSDFEIENQKVQMVSTHLLNFVSTKVYIQNLENVAEELQKTQGPSVFAGDFNTWNKKRLDAVRSVTKSLGYTMVEFEDDQRWLKLDHVFVKGLDVPHAQIQGSIKSSDHEPLVLTIKLPK